MPYKVLIVIKGGWWSDHIELPSFVAAQRHRKIVSERWSDCDTAILAPDQRVLVFRESVLELAKFAAEAAE